MSNQSQIPVEEIVLIPHALDAWRMALNALIAVAPGTAGDIAVHLKEARENTLVFHDRLAATPGEARMIDRLMLLGAGKLVGQQLDQQRAAGSPHPADHIASASRRVHLHPTQHSSAVPAGSPAAALGEPALSAQQQQPGEATPETARSAAHPPFLSDQS